MSDVLGVSGFLLLVGGACWLSVPAGLMLLGAGLMATAYRLHTLGANK